MAYDVSDRNLCKSLCIETIQNYLIDSSCVLNFLLH